MQEHLQATKCLSTDVAEAEKATVVAPATLPDAEAELEPATGTAAETRHPAVAAEKRQSVLLVK